MSCRATLCAVCVFIAVFTVLPLAAADLLVVSQNTLHLGWGDTNPSNGPISQYKIDAIWGNISQGHIAVLQEAMPNAPLGKFSKCVGTCKVLESPLYGHSWYREKYVFIVVDSSTLKPAASVTECKDVPNANCAFSRPPASLLLSPANSKGIWVVNFHAIWGKTKSARQNEATNVRTLYAALQAPGSAVVVGGDWNLTAEEVAAQVGCSAACVVPTDPTTLKTDGSDVSSSYDHFISSLNYSKFGIFTPPDYKVWRQKVSDHLGVGAVYTY